MSKIADQEYLKNEQYKDTSNLDARVEIHKRFSINPQGWHNWVFDALLKVVPARARILELGCGPGYLWMHNVERIPAGWDITLSDFSDGMLDAAWRNLVVTGRNFKFEKIDAQSIPSPEEIINVVIANHMLYHVPDRIKAIAEICRVLKPGGHLLATTVGERHMRELTTWAKRASQDGAGSMFAAIPFTLENGLAQLQPYFSEIDIQRYPDGLRITEVEPVIAYIRSTSNSDKLSEPALAELCSKLQAEIKAEGMLRVTKDSGLFVAVK